MKTSWQKHEITIMKVYFLNRLEKIVANGEIAHDEQFLHLLQSFQKLSAAETSESVHMWESVKLSTMYNY